MSDNRMADGIAPQNKFAKVWEQTLIIVRLAFAERGGAPYRLFQLDLD
ncbi:MAG: hypothetical protein F6K29_02615 [Okeania sp. SIO2G5]|nr:hypothetical protein [Okeania sp. SIO2G5]